MTQIKISICRVYTPPPQKEGVWILIDRLWPRGLKKDKLPFDSWLKDLAPSSNLRIWFHKDPTHWPEFVVRYQNELQEQAQLIEQTLHSAADSSITLFYAAKNIEKNHALVLQAVMRAWPEKADIKALLHL